jgi:hypothetical protein
MPVLTKVTAGTMTSSFSVRLHNCAASQRAEVHVDVAKAQPFRDAVKRFSKDLHAGPYPSQPELMHLPIAGLVASGSTGLFSGIIAKEAFCDFAGTISKAICLT